MIKIRCVAALAIACGLVSACAMPFLGGYGPNHQSREEFTHYAEGVFRLQNQMASEVMMLINDGSPRSNDLLQAEQTMQKVCADLNEYVSRDIDGLSSGFFLSRRVEKSIIDCEQAALAVKQLLQP